MRATVCRCDDRSASCSVCHGHGSHSYQDADGYSMARSCPRGCVRRNLLVRWITQARLPSHHYRVADWDFYAGDDAATAARARRWVRGKRDGGIWLASNPGSGKTCLSVLLAREAVTLGSPALWVGVPALLDQARKGMRENRDPIERVLAAELLVLDDIDKVRLGAGKHTEWVDEQLWRIITCRCEADLATIVTSNISVSDWCKRTRNAAAVQSRLDGHFFRATLTRADARGVRGAL